VKVIVFGAGEYGRRYCQEYGSSVQVIAFADNSSEKQKEKYLGHVVIDPKDIILYDYDKIVIAIYDYNDKGSKIVSEILEKLHMLGVEHSKIAIAALAPYPSFHPNRIEFLRKFSEIFYEDSKEDGVIAECGVLRGHYSAYMNMLFPDKKLYLFDTFKGFDNRDLETEKNVNTKPVESSNPYMKIGNADIALLRCPHPDKVVIKEGYIPDTFAGMEDKRFLFVHLDMDLYQPTLAALRFFLPRIVQGGVILLHDYYCPWYTGVKEAVKEFTKEASFTYMPIGDDLSIAIIPSKDSRL